MELVIEGVPGKSWVLAWAQELDEEQRTRLQAVLAKQAVYTLGFYAGSAIANVESVVTKQEVVRKLKTMLKKAKLDHEKLHTIEPLDLFNAEKWGWVIPYAKPVTISAGSSTDPPPAAPATTPAAVAWLGKAPANLTVVRSYSPFRQLEWLKYRAGLCAVELKKEPEGFPAFLALYRHHPVRGGRQEQQAGGRQEPLGEVHGRQAEGEGAEPGVARHDQPDQRGGS